jgi:hypothetical protein
MFHRVTERAGGGLEYRFAPVVGAPAAQNIDV